MRTVQNSALKHGKLYVLRKLVTQQANSICFVPFTVCTWEDPFKQKQKGNHWAMSSMVLQIFCLNKKLLFACLLDCSHLGQLY